MDVAVDTNILAYAYGIDDAARRDRAVQVLARLPGESMMAPVQVLAELYNVLCRKGRWPAPHAQAAVQECRDRFAIRDSSESAFVSALDLATTHGLQIWDALILAVAAQAGCRLLLSEDLQHGFTWGGTTVINPFLPDMHPLLATAMSH